MGFRGSCFTITGPAEAGKTRSNSCPDSKGCCTVQAADEPFNLFGASCRSFILRPLIGIITKIDSPYANIPMVRQWLINAGCERIFMVNNVTREGIDELMEYLQEDTPKLTLEQAKFKQSLGLNEWDPLPEGVAYPEEKENML